MADQLQLRGGTTTEHATFTGALREVTVDTTKKTLVVHDNATAGGTPLAKENLSNVPAGTITSTMIADGTIATADIADGAVTSAKIADGTIVNADINAAAAIDLTKLANGALPSGITVSSANITDLTLATADIADGAVTSAKIADGTIVNADVNASAAIAGTKISPDFGSQNVTTTGTVTGASLSPTSSTAPTNGVYLPAANTVGISTNGTGRLFVNSSGQVGIGGSPSNALHVITASAGNAFRISNGANLARLIFASNSTSSIFTENSSLDIAATEANNITLSTNASERLRITSAGLVGVGTSSPSDTSGFGGTLDVNGTTGAACYVRTNGSATNFGLIGHYGTDLYVTNNSNGPTRFFTNGGERLRITSAGLVGIGTSSPGATFHVNGGSASRTGYFVSTDTSAYSPTSYSQYHRLYLQGGAATNAYNGIGFTNGSNSEGFIGFVQNASGYGDFVVQSYTGSYGEKLRVTSAGNVGIGTTSPGGSQSALLHVVGSGACQFTIDGTSAGGSYLTFENNGTARYFIGSGAQLGGGTVSELALRSQTGGGITFLTNGSNERARIDSSGRLLVGTNSVYADSSELFEVYKANGPNNGWVSTPNLANDDSVSWRAVGGVSGVTLRQSGIGVYKHSGIATPCGFLYMQAQNADTLYYWTDNSSNFRISTLASNIGTTGGTVVGTQTSDERIKNILGPVEYGLDEIKQIEPVRYSLKAEPDVEKLGFIAQQVQPLIPQSIFDTNEHIEGEPEDAPTKLGMEYVSLIPVLVNAIKELSAEVDALKTQLQAK